MYLALNNGYSTLAASLGDLITDTTVTVQTGHGSRFAVGSDYTYATLEAASGAMEIVKITGQSGDTLTVVRGQDGTTRLTWNIGDIIEVRPCKAAMTDIKADAVTAADIGAQIAGATEKTTPVDADQFGISDSAASSVKKRLNWLNIKNTLKTYLDTLYAKIGVISGSGLTMNTAKVLGRSTAGTGAIEELSASTLGLSLLNSSSQVNALTTLGAILNSGSTQSGAYTVVAADKGKVINCTGTFSLSLTAAATLADGFTFAVLNSGSGTITIDPDASELIDGALTKTLAAGKLAIVYCDGSKFATVGSDDPPDLTPYKNKNGATAGTSYSGGRINVSTTGVTSPTKVLSVRVLVTGVVRCAWGLSNCGDGGYHYARIYKNGVAAGTQRTSVSDAYAGYTDDISVTAGDVIQLYVWASHISFTTTVWGIGIGVSNPGLHGEIAYPVQAASAYSLE